jgi:hypothetical protein
LSEAVAETVAVPETVAPDAGELMETTGGVLSVLLTVKDTAALVVVCPVELLATATSEWLALASVVVFRDKLNGALVTAPPELLPSTMNCTLLVLADTLVETVTAPETVAPESGELIEIVGAVDGAVELLTLTIDVPLMVERPDKVLATAASEWLALESVVVFREKLNGALVTAAPELLPSTRNCTLAVLAETLVATVIVPETVEPETGAIIEIVGGRLLTLIEEEELLTDLPVELVATAVSEYAPSDNLDVSSE